METPFDYFFNDRTNPRTIEALRGGPLASPLEAYAQRSLEDGYAAHSVLAFFQDSFYGGVAIFASWRETIKCRYDRKCVGAGVERAIRINIGFRAGQIVEDKVIVEIKSVESLAPVHKKQLLTNLRLANKRLGLLINFNTVLIKDGITREQEVLTAP